MGLLSLIQLPGGIAWLDTGSHSSLLDAGNFVRSIQSNQGLLVGSPDEVALRNGWVSTMDLKNRIKKMGKGAYAQSLRETLLNL